MTSVRIAEHRNVGVMGREDDLAIGTPRQDCTNQSIGDEGVIDMVFWLIHDQQSFGVAKHDG